MNYSPKIINNLIETGEIKIKKKFGQNFIIDENIIDSIINKSEIDKNSLIIEIGPGIGALTYKLADFAKNVLCYEIDNSLKEILEDNLKGKPNVNIIYQDFLKSNIKKDIEKYSYNKISIVANLPYYITTPIIIKIIEDNLDIAKMIVMVQKEVGNRFKAQPGTKDYGSLSVYLNYYFDVRKLIDVSRNVFIPKPNVDSIVVEFKKKPILLPLKDKDLFFKLIRDSFKKKRKTIKNNLKEYDLSKIEKTLEKYNYSLSSRAEELKVEIFVDMANNL